MSLARPIHYETHHSQSHPPPQMSTSNNPPAPAPYSFDAARASSLNAASSPNPYGTAPLPKAMVKLCPKLTSPPGPSHEPPPPPSFARPQMPPPSSPTQQHLHASQSQRPQYTSNFGANRELPGLGQALRPGSSMSISSLIGGGGDTGALNPNSAITALASHQRPSTQRPQHAATFASTWPARWFTVGFPSVSPSTHPRAQHVRQQYLAAI